MIFVFFSAESMHIQYYKTYKIDQSESNIEGGGEEREREGGGGGEWRNGGMTLINY